MKKQQEQNLELKNAELEKQLAEKNRDLEIEASLERVRTAAMAMAKPDDLLNICKLTYVELQALGFKAIRNSQIFIFDDPHGAFINYGFSDDEGANIAEIFYDSHPRVKEFITTVRKTSDAFAELSISGDELIAWRQYRIDNGEPDDVRLGNIDALYYYFYSIGIGAIGISNFEALPGKQRQILKRFRNVFDLAYRRYADIQLAEAQAREAQIELALERVRARTMAMQHSEELAETAFILFQQFKELGENPDQATIGIINEEEQVIEYWVTMYGSQVNKMFKFPIDEPIVTHKIYKAWKAKKTSLVIDLSGKYLHTFTKYRESMGGAKFDKNEKRRVINVAFFSKGLINVQSSEERSAESIRLLERFAGVFDGTYTRFLDLKKAEAQAHEAQIELSLERVRASAMAMHKTEDLHVAGALLFKGLAELGINTMAACYALISEDERSANYYGMNPVDGKIVATPWVFPHTETEVMRAILASWKKHDAFYVIELDEQDTLKHHTWAGGAMLAGLKKVDPDTSFTVEAFLAISPQKAILHTFNFPQGYLFIATGQRLTTEQEGIARRFTKVFEMTYRRFLDLQKAEAQTRESQIELALERVRARTMAMQKSEELKEIIKVVYEQLIHLNILAEHAGFIMDYRANDNMNIWLADKHFDPSYITIPYFDSPHWNSFIEAKAKGTDFFANLLNFEEKNKFYQDLFALVSGVTDEAREFYMNCPGLAGSTVLLDNVGLYIENFSGIPYTDEENSTLMRFGKVFQQTYTRFLDLQKAEAQAREAQIELALERVRARTMAMYHSKELAETAAVLFEQLSELGSEPARISIGIMDQEKGLVNFWATDQEGDQIDISFIAPVSEKTTISKMHAGWQAKLKSLSIELEGKELAAWVRFCREEMGIIIKDELLQKRRVHTVGYFSQGWINYTTHTLPSPETRQILERFATMFSYTYTRFLDLQKAEDQAKESQIQLALERVRARTMAMQKSGELNEVIQLIYDQLRQLNFNLDTANFTLNYTESDDLDLWIAVAGARYATKICIPYFDHPMFARFNEAKAKGGLYVDSLTLEEKNSFFEHFFKYAPEVPAERRALVFDQPGFARSAAFMKNIALTIINYKGTPFSEAENNTLLRFGQVFDQTYTRFKDLEQAEQQARESQIQLGLERVRAKAMAMQTSEELNELIGTVFSELTKLDFVLTRCLIMIFDPETKASRWWMANSEAPAEPMNYLVKNHKNPAYDAYLKAWKERNLKWNYTLKGKVKRDWDDFLFSDTELAELPKPVIEGMKAPEQVLLSACFNNFGSLTLVTLEPLSDEHSDIMLRFAKVFDMCYTRFNDLKQAEEQARESQIQLALERVRARTMAMQRSEELAETATVLFQQLYSLDVTPERVFIGVPDDRNRTIGLWGTEQGGTGMSTRFEAHADGAYSMSQIFKGWEDKKTDMTVFLSGEHLDEHINYVANIMHMPVRMELVQDHRILYCTYFSKGMFVVVTPDVQSEETLSVLRRFAAVFDQTYTRFLDLQKAEAQARESQIQLGLERVRAAAMAMHDSNDVGNATALVFSELYKLGITTIRCGVCIIDGAMQQMEVWSATSSQEGKVNRGAGKLDMTAHPLWIKLWNAWKQKQSSFTYELKGKELADYYKAITNASGYHAPDSNAVYMALDDEGKSRQFCNCFLFNEGCVFAFTQMPFSTETSQVLEKFTAVFGLTYRRYLDLTRAEAQVHEAQIEAALERVRSKTMAMHNSEDVADTVATMFNELVKLGVEKTARCGISIIYDNREMELWRASYNADGKADMLIGRIDMTIHSSLTEVYHAWKNNDTVYSCELTGDNQQDYFRALNDSPTYPVQFDLTSLPVKQTNTVFFFPEGCLFAFTLEPLSEETVKLFKRFAGVFGQTYRRYLDLLKAETSAREAQIEAALERVRSKTMAMHNSADVGETVTLMFNELIKLGVEKMARCGIAIPDDKRTIELWTAKFSEGEKAEIIIGHIDTGIHPMLGSLYDAWKSKQPTFEHILKGDDLVNYITALNNSAGYPIKYDMKAWGGIQYHNDFFFHEGMVFAFTFEPLSAEIAVIFKRFAGVFGQTYRRYLDLQKAEAAAREAQIEAALERVRSKAMAMRSSGDLNDTANTVFIELRKLGVDLVRCGLGLMEKETHISTIHAATNSDEGGSLEVLGNINMGIHPVFVGIYDHWRKNEDYFPVLEGKSLKAYYEKLHESDIAVPEWKSGKKQYGYFLQFAYGSLYAWSGKQESEITIKTLKRFTSVISLTYTRYIELQKAESNTKEAIKQASLDRVRAEIASMRKRSDLERITPLIWDELTILGIPFIRCGVFIMDEEQKLIHTFLSTPDGKAIGAFHIPFDTSGNFEKMVDSWRHGVPYIDHWEEEAFSQFADTLVKQGAIASKAQYMRTLPHEGIHLNFLPFLQGMLYVGNIEPLTEDNISLIQAVADAFSTAYARYEDFNKLEAAKQQVDNTLSDLKATQTRLIQSEKMASLGELTAGIAHEIQNPLNFVNNFSEVNQEMIDELAEELKAGHIEEALAIAADIRDNEEKINHHGKRADGIVKGMLQHSRTGGGEKELTNINTLSDEFLRLSYHGLRAKDKEFNAELVTHFDEKLPKVSVIPQDIGRVLLNLFNNAFYAVNQKQKMAGADYKPEVSVTTSTENEQIIIKVKDNGVGMPDAIKDKIMQPFFTTKPTGEGTGLGLSLTYDMVVKGHGGSIAVASKDGEGSEFKILLPIN